MGGLKDGRRGEKKDYSEVENGGKRKWPTAAVPQLTKNLKRRKGEFKPGRAKDVLGHGKRSAYIRKVSGEGELKRGAEETLLHHLGTLIGGQIDEVRNTLNRVGGGNREKS